MSVLLADKIHIHWSDPREALVQFAVLAAGPVAGLLFLVRDFRAAVLARGILWCGLTWLTLISLFERPEPSLVAYGLFAGMALLMAGSLDLDSARGSHRFNPVALRGTLLAIIMMSVSDMLALLFLTLITLEARDAPTLFFFAGAATMAAAVWGLLRLRGWAFALNVAANLVIAGAAWVYASWGNFPEPLAYCFTATAAGQLLAGAPLAWRVLRGNATSAPGLGSSRFLGAAAVVTAMLILAGRLWVRLP